MLNIYRINNEEKIVKGIGLPAFIHNGSYFQVTIGVYEDGMIDCWELVDLDEFKNKVLEGWVVTEVPDEESINCHHLYYGISNLNYYVEINEFVKEVEDTLNELQGRETRQTKCIAAFIQYLAAPTSDNKQSLCSAYELTPRHLRQYLLGDMDRKDHPIKDCVENDDISPQTLSKYKEWYSYLVEKII